MPFHPSTTARGCLQMQQFSQLSRRDVLTAGLGGMLGLGLESLLAQSVGAGEGVPAARLPGFGKAKRCIFLLMWGGPSQLDTFDLKPNAPATVRGSFNPSATKVPGLQICEHFQQLAGVMDKVAVIRSLTHTDPAHLSSGHATVTGQWAPKLRSDDAPPSSKDSPHLGALAAHYFQPKNNLPASVIVPWKAFHPAALGGEAPGQHGGWMGPSYDPLLASGDPNDPQWKLPALILADGLTPAILDSRYELLRNLDQQRQALDQSAAATRLNAQQQKALGLLSSPAVRQAFDLSAEPPEVRDRYGRNTHGQCVLLARRLVERGVPIVTVNWHNDGKSFWDTHGDNFNRLKNDLIPAADRALATLLTELSERGLLEDTIIAWVGEFGRRPQITAANAGREHWPFCYNGLLAGGGIAGGATYGSSDSTGSYPASNPVSPLDFAATIMHALGIPAQAAILDRSNRPHQVYGGKALDSLFT